jgi:hypothetical protein
MIDTLFASDDSGSVAIVGTPNEMLNPGDTITCYVGIAVGDNEMEMMFNMADVQAIYDALITGVQELSDAVPGSYELNQNYPNPFNPVTKIEFSLPQESDVTLTVYNSLGEKVALLINENLPAGKYSSSFDASALSSGVYFYRLTAGSFSATNKMILIK